MRRFKKGAILFFAAVTGAGAAPQPLEVVPAPLHVDVGPGRMAVNGAFAASGLGSDARLQDGVARLLRDWERRTGLQFGRAPGDGSSLVLVCPVAGPAIPQLGEDESYDLEIKPDGARLRASTADGVLRGLATLTQLLRQDKAEWFLPVVSIHDQPRFPWRSLMIDVSRHWESADVIRRNLDGMALVKLNVLHLHLTDDQGFRIQCLSHPELTAQGSDGHFFTQTEMRALVAYAADRGIRVVPEFDLPGHATSWLVSHRELSSGPGPYQIERHWGVFDPVMDPTDEGTYRLLGNVFKEMAALFPDPFFHIGGDENDGVEWNANPRIQAFIREHGLGDNAGLQAYFNRRVGAILAGLGKRMVGWDEILHPDLPHTAVIESWRGAEALSSAAQLGYDGILAHGYYIDLGYPAADYYLNDPAPGRAAVESGHVLGGDATMWGEWVDPETIDSRIWPRTAAIAERLWSPANVRDVGDLYRRLDFVDARLAEAGLRQKSYRSSMLLRLLDGRGDPATVAALATFVDAVEPVKAYLRGKQQPGSDQWTPLVGVADAAGPDSPGPRHFSTDVDQWLSDSGERPESAPDQVSAILSGWRHAGIFLGDRAGRWPGVAPAAPLARQLADASQLGLEAVGFIGAGRPAPAEWTAAALARLKSDEEPHDAVEIAALPAIRRLILAAASSPPHHDGPNAITPRL